LYTSLNQRLRLMPASFAETKNMRHFLLFSWLLMTLTVSAQEIDWFTQKHQINFESFYDMVYVDGPSEPYLVMNYNTNQPGTTPQQPSTGLDFIYAVDTNGNFLWQREVYRVGQIVSGDDGTFWWIVGGVDSLDIGGTMLYNDGVNNFPDYRTYYYVRMDGAGNVISYFTKESVLNNDWVGTYTYDGNGHFVISGAVGMNGFGLLPFNYGNYYDTLEVGHEELLFVARLDTMGNELDFYPFKSTWATPAGKSKVPGVVSCIESTGDLVFAIGLGDTLVTPDTMLIGGSVLQAALIRLNDQFQMEACESYQLGKYGNRFARVKYNPEDGMIYAHGAWGDTLYIDQGNLISGHPGSVNNLVVAKFSQSLELIDYRYFIPQSYISSLSFMYLNFQHSIAIDGSGNLHLAGHLRDSLFVSNDTTLRYYQGTPSGAFQHKSFYITLDTNLDIRYDLVPEDDKGMGNYESVAAEPNGGSVFLAGKFTAEYKLNQISTNTPTNWYDGMLLRVRDTAFVPKVIEDDEDTIVVIDDDTAVISGLDQAFMTHQTRVFPNPFTNGQLEVETASPILQLQVTDLLGRPVKHNVQPLNASTQHVQVEILDAASGPVYLSLLTEKGWEHHMLLPAKD